MGSNDHNYPRKINKKFFNDMTHNQLDVGFLNKSSNDTDNKSNGDSKNKSNNGSNEKSNEDPATVEAFL